MIDEEVRILKATWVLTSWSLFIYVYKNAKIREHLRVVSSSRTGTGGDSERRIKEGLLE